MTQIDSAPRGPWHYTTALLLAALALSCSAGGQAGTQSSFPAAGETLKAAAGGAAPRSSACPFVNSTNLCVVDPPYDADRTGARDSTSAFNRAVAALSQTGGYIWVPDGTYKINGSLQDSAGANAQIPMPKLVNYGSRLIDIYISGFTRPNWNVNADAALNSNLAFGNVFGGYDPDSNGTQSDFRGFTNVKLHLHNLRITLPPKSGATVVDGSYLMALDVQHALLNVGLGAIASNWAVRFPTLGNEVQNFLDDVQIGGFYNGYQLTEHTRVGSIYSAGGTNCFVFDNGPNTPGGTNRNGYRNGVPLAYTGNSVDVQYLWGINCANTIVGGSQRTTVNIKTADIELPGADGIHDPKNVLYGVVNWNNPYAPYGKVINGGQNLTIVALDGKEPSPAAVNAGSGVSGTRFLTTFTDLGNNVTYSKPFTDSRFTVNATLNSALGANGTIAQVVFGHMWVKVPNCQITPTAIAANAYGPIGYTWYSGSFYLTALSAGLPAGVYTWDVSCTDR